MSLLRPLSRSTTRTRLPRRALLAGLLMLSACGLQPVYGPGGAATKLFGQVRPADPDTPDEFVFNQRISERLGGEGSTYDLDYTLRIGVVAQGITPDEVTTRYSLNGSANFRLTDATTGTTVTQGQVSSFTSYSTTDTTVATLTAEYDARQRLARMLADQVITRLLAAAP